MLERVKENIVFLENPEAIEEKGGYVPGGILLWGPPGTGKTLMAEAVAGETGKPYVFVDPGAFINMFMGVGILKVKSLFRKLRKLALRYGGVIVFFDEADSLGNRGALARAARPAAACDTPAPWDALQRVLLPVRATQASLIGSAPGPGADAGPHGAGVDGVVMGGMGGGGMGTLQALLTELSGLKKPRGFLNRVVRRALGMRPKPPPKYRILVMMATNMPQRARRGAAAAGPHRPHLQGRLPVEGRAGCRTYEGYFAKVQHELTAEQIDKLATITPYATGATIKDLVNEALIIAIRDGPRHHHVARRDPGQAAQERRTARGRRVHRARAPRRRHARGLPRGRWATCVQRTGTSSTSRPSRRARHYLGLVATDPDRGTLHSVAHRVRGRHHGQPRLTGRRADVLRRRQLLGRLR